MFDNLVQFLSHPARFSHCLNTWIEQFNRLSYCVVFFFQTIMSNELCWDSPLSMTWEMPTWRLQEQLQISVVSWWRISFSWPFHMTLSMLHCQYTVVLYIKMEGIFLELQSRLSFLGIVRVKLDEVKCLMVKCTGPSFLDHPKRAYLITRSAQDPSSEVGNLAVTNIHGS